MHKPLVTFLLLFIAIHASCQVVNARHEAEKMAQRAQGFQYEIENNVGGDSTRYFRNIMDAIDYSLKSDEYDRQADVKKTGKLRHADGNRKRLTAYRPLLIDAGLYLSAHHYRQDGINAWKLYIKASASPLLSDDKKNDETALAAFYISQAELEARNYELADYFADLALSDDEIAQDAAEIKAQCMHDTMVSREDSAKYLSVLAELYRSDPANKMYFGWLMQFYSKNNRNFNLENFIDDQLMNNPDSPVPWILKGETAMHAGRWNEAADAYRHADEIDPKRIPVVFNIGVCLMNLAIEYGKNEGGSIENVNSLYAQVRNYLERVRTMDPHRDKVDWVTPLHSVYEFLGDKVKAEELTPLMKK